ncbi:MAG: methionine--tRNA ligase subunit beta [Thermoprotei archaeon]|nr:MAG: methionine--tRNA ligase subunit beta [Thermoprotei archaeon]
MSKLYDVKEFWKFNIRVGYVKEAERVPRSRKLIKMIVDFGDHKRTIVAGIGDQYAPEDLKDKKTIFVINLKPKKVMGVESQGMLLVAESEGKVYPIILSDEVPTGAKVW